MNPYEYLLNKLNIRLKFIGWTHEQIFKYFRNIYSSEHYRQCDKELDFFCLQCQQLSYFPNELESIEHVDLLLTLNGMNKGA